MAAFDTHISNNEDLSIFENKNNQKINATETVNTEILNQVT